MTNSTQHTNSIDDKYQKSLKALMAKNLLRKPKILNNKLIDFASNDYLNLANNKKLAKKAYKKAYLSNKSKTSLSQSSMLVGGYSKIQKDTKKLILKNEKFEKCIILGSGFLGNIALFSSLIRANDRLYMDESYHASGILASNEIANQREFFVHNCPKDLETKLKNKTHSGVSIIAIEGIYSMSGEIAKKEFASLALKYNCILIVDEAHSSGVLGNRLKGWYEYYKIKISNNSNFIKLGTFSKAYGSYGAYILSNRVINLFLLNRAKSIIYSTALSAFDCALAYYHIKHINKNYKKLKNKLNTANAYTAQQIQKLIDKKYKSTPNSKTCIHTIIINDNKKVVNIQKKLIKYGFFVGAIRQPSVKQALLRISISTRVSKKQIKKLFELLSCL